MKYHVEVLVRSRPNAHTVGLFLRGTRMRYPTESTRVRISVCDLDDGAHDHGTEARRDTDALVHLTP